MSTIQAQNKYPAPRDLSPGAQAAAAWFRQLARTLKICRLYRTDNPLAKQARLQLFQQIVDHLTAHGVWNLRITATEIFLGEEPIVHPSAARTDDTPTAGSEERLPFLFYRDGIRSVTIRPGLPLQDYDALFDALLAASSSPLSHDDLVTLLWQANPVKVQIDAIPLSQTIYLSSRTPTGDGEGGGRKGQAFAWSPSGAEIRAGIGQVAGVAQGLHKDTFDDWLVPGEYVEVREAYERLQKGSQFTRTMFLTDWAAERAVEWTRDVAPVLRRVLALDPGPDTRAALAHAVVTWLVAALQDSSWLKAQEALELLKELDPDGSLTNEFLTQEIAGLDTDEIAERMDESEADDQARFFGVAVAIGHPALSLATGVMAKAVKSRTRAAACTMLCYLCNDRPKLLAPFLTDSRWYVVRNTVFVLGQIGGADVAWLLEAVAQHPEVRVRRQVVQSLGNVPSLDRLPILLSQLNARDPQLLSAALQMLLRDKRPEVGQAILKQITAPDFETRSGDNQRALLNALAEVADDRVVPALEAMLLKGGWFARRTFERVAAARTLQRIGTPRARAVLEAGLKSRSEAVRQACLEATTTKAA
jgi:HEAT repeat protein